MKLLSLKCREYVFFLPFNMDCHSVLRMCEPAYEDESAMDTSQHYSGQTIGERVYSIQPVWQPGKNSAVTAYRKTFMHNLVEGTRTMRILRLGCLKFSMG